MPARGSRQPLRATSPTGDQVDDSGSHTCFYEHNWYGGAEFKIGRWERWPSVPSWINDKTSSFKYC
ncbi:hypothetical protein ACGF0D_42400 [Kitasatospora sp. NPDC048298]|uniref:hypothetical protein n=1 Tax=Kitasatospora sp. NPDC048298 TaxID=3364049 RepID=UPI003712203B